MKISIVKIGEPLLSEGVRARRMTRYARTLIAKGHEVTWWTSNWNHQKKQVRDASILKEKAAIEGIKLNIIKAPGYRRNISARRLLHHYIFAKKLVHLINHHPNPNVLWVCFPTVPVAVNLARWARRKQVKIIFDIRDLSPDIFLEHAPSALKTTVDFLLRPTRFSIGKAFSTANGLVAVSQGYLEWAERLALRHQRLPPFRQVLPLGYEMEDLSEARIKELKTNLLKRGVSEDGSVKFIYAGGFGHSYDIFTVLTAAQLVSKNNLNVQIIIAGGGALQDEVTAVAKESKHLVYLGWLEGDELQVLLSMADVGLMPYSHKATQGFPNKIYEYMAHGLVLISSLHGDSQEFMKANRLGFYYSPKDVQALYDLIEYLTNHPDVLVETSNNAIRVYQERFGSNHMTQNMVEFTNNVFLSNIMSN